MTTKKRILVERGETSRIWWFTIVKKKGKEVIYGKAKDDKFITGHVDDVKAIIRKHEPDYMY